MKIIKYSEFSTIMGFKNYWDFERFNKQPKKQTNKQTNKQVNKFTYNLTATVIIIITTSKLQ